MVGSVQRPGHRLAGWMAGWLAGWLAGVCILGLGKYTL